MRSELKDKRVHAEKGKLESYLHQHGRQMSSGRIKVFNIIMTTHGHFAAEDLVKICQKNKIKVSRATIYRSIKELLEARVIRETAYGEKHQLFEHLYDEKPHHHARCLRCHIVVELADQHEDRIYQPQLKQKGFQVIGHEMHFYGFCKDCG